MRENKLVCPHCGHDGTSETARSPLECWGFNCLVDDVVAREVKTFDKPGKIELARDFRCEGVLGTNPRIECRCCWQTFPLPAGMQVELASGKPSRVVEFAEGRADRYGDQFSDEVTGTRERPSSEEGLPPEEMFPAGLKKAAEQMVTSLTGALGGAVEELRRLVSEDVGKLEAAVAEIAQSTEQIPSLRDEIADLRKEPAALLEAHGQLVARLTELENQAAEHETRHEAVQEQVQRLTDLHQSVSEDMEAQYKAISDLQEGMGLLEGTVGAQKGLIEEKTVAHGVGMDRVNERMGHFDSGLQAQTEAVAKLHSFFAEVQEAQQRLQTRLDAQAEAIRAVHLVTEEQAARREELRIASQKLEEIAGALERPKPLPESL